MNLSRSLFATLAAGCAGTALGFFAGSEEPVGGAKTSTAAIANSPASTGAQGEPGKLDASAASRPETPTRTFRDESEARKTLQALIAEPDLQRRARELDLLCAAVDEPGVKALVEALQHSPADSSFAWALTSDLLARWAEIDPRAAADHVLGMDARHRIYSLSSVIGTWAESDLSAAKEWALHVRGREAHRQGFSAVVRFVAAKDPRSALALLKELPPEEDKTLYLYDVFRVLGAKNPALATDLATQLPTRTQQATAVRELTSSWAEKEPDKALAWYLQNRPPQDDDWQARDRMKKMLKNWTRTAPQDAAAFAGALPAGRTRTTVIDQLSDAWGAVDPEAAATWLKALPKSAESYRAFDSLVGSWTQSDPLKAANFILAQPADRSRDWLLNTLGRTWAADKPEAALAWAQQQNDPTIERQVGAEAAGALAAKDLPNAQSYLDQMKTPQARKLAVSATASALTYRSPDRAAKWVLQMASTGDVGNAIEWPVESWTWRDSDAVGTWLNEQSASAQKDAAVGSYASALARKDAPAAAAWASTIGDEKLRQRRLQDVVRTWSNKDSTAARAWVTKQSFTPEAQQALLKLVK